jgi:hypothetical protein
MTNPQLPVDPNYPRWVYSAQFPKGRLVHNQAELFTLKGDWFSHPDQREESKIDLPTPEPVVAADPVSAKGKPTKAEGK